MVVCEFCMGNFISPGGGVRSTEDSQIGFNFLVDLFGFSIRLRMVGSREGKIISYTHILEWALGISVK